MRSTSYIITSEARGGEVGGAGLAQPVGDHVYLSPKLASPSFSLDLGSSHQWPVPSGLCHLLCAGFLHPQVWTALRTSGDPRS